MFSKGFARLLGRFGRGCLNANQPRAIREQGGPPDSWHASFLIELGFIFSTEYFRAQVLPFATRIVHFARKRYCTLVQWLICAVANAECLKIGWIRSVPFSSAAGIILLKKKSRATVIVVDDDTSCLRAQCDVNYRFWDSAYGTIRARKSFWQAKFRSATCACCGCLHAGMTGIELCHSLAASGRYLPTILISGRDDEPTRKMIREAKPISSLLKNFDEKDLLTSASEGIAASADLTKHYRPRHP